MPFACCVIGLFGSLISVVNEVGFMSADEPAGHASEEPLPTSASSAFAADECHYSPEPAHAAQPTANTNRPDHPAVGTVAVAVCSGLPQLELQSQLQDAQGRLAAGSAASSRFRVKWQHSAV